MTRREDEGWLASSIPDDTADSDAGYTNGYPDELVARRRGVLYRQRPVNRLWPVVVSVLGLGAALAGQLLVVLPTVESDLRTRAMDQLRAAGYTKLQVFVDGRDVILNGTLPSLSDVDRATAIVERVNGVRVVREVFVSYPNAAGAKPSSSSSAGASPSTTVSGASTSIPAASPGLTTSLAQLATLGATLDSGDVTLVGEVPTDRARVRLDNALAATFGATRVMDKTTVDPAAGTVGQDGFVAVLAALGTTTRAGAVSLRAGRMTVAGVTTDAGTRAAVAAAAVGAVGSDPTNLTTSLVVDAGTSAVTDAEIVAQLAALLPIPFATGSSGLGAPAMPLVGLAAELLKNNPQLRVQVEGHTEVGGDPAANLALSRARAAAVVAALQNAGVPGRQLAAFGYGSTRPLATGSGPVADAVNRRVVFVAG